ncbi:aminotransferase class I/II-fold pyridoxal phosphate-dependent enzyme [Microbacterium saperdae]|uniref:DNA-binding transcriptional MocR family regulator n=1 Tax=Microbacterium saperdae TaxID=69368 RepID=A0A543BMM4_9MICO|nr:aminotransferase class I/II-fold pyridoxal phosphate-dependent enzyme [Microbacterium saperdae]TQL86063.1 DNA-binding transcriptional MocR family regulator [Microbacterium saperdae]GGM50879.1 transcriptional regulator PtsJ [Microbacterium saperdae]
MSDDIRGTTAADIADSVRALRERGALRPGSVLPPVRELAARLGVNRNTAVAAYRQLAQAGLVVSRGRAGTVIAGVDAVAQEGYASDTVLRDVATGNPDPALIPDPSPALATVAGRPVLYGEPVIDRGLDAWTRDWVAPDLSHADFRITVTSGAVDAVERLLAQALTRDDAVALEDPCFLASIHTVRLGGYRAVPVPVDEEGMTVEGLRTALAAGVRAVICTPRAQNPTGASLSARRASELRAVLVDHPYVLLIEDDHFSMLSQRPYESLIGPGHRRYALVRSVSKFLGPDMCLAIAATDPETADRLAMRLSPGTTWVSHLLQRLTLAQLTDAEVSARVASAGAHYAARNAAFTARLREHGIDAPVTDGLSLWIELPRPARLVVERLMRRGWLARTGDEFALGDRAEPSHHLRLTVHDLSDDDAATLVTDLVAAVR